MTRFHFPTSGPAAAADVPPSPAGGVTDLLSHTAAVSPPAACDAAASHERLGVLSVFPGIDLFGRGFEAEGYWVVRGPDLIWGGDVRHFHVQPGVFVGVIGGSPCQDFSRSRRTPPTGNGVKMLAEFCRIVSEAMPDWFCLENVPGVPDIGVPGYRVQRFNLSGRDCNVVQKRLRSFQFGSRDAAPLLVDRTDTGPRATSKCAMASEGGRADRRSFADFCELQGLPRSFDLPGLSIAAKYRAVGNGVPIPMARVIAAAIRRRRDTLGVRLCVCECGRPVAGKQTHATAACRKRMERKRRDSSSVTPPGPVTPRRSRFPDSTPDLFHTLTTEE